MLTSPLSESLIALTVHTAEFEIVSHHYELVQETEINHKIVVMGCMEV